MVTRWKPDTCECIIEYSGNFKDAKFIKKCKLHNKATDVVTHNQGFNRKYEDTTDKKERMNLIVADKKAELQRIKNIK